MCCIFESPTVEDAGQKINKQFKTIEDYGSVYNHPDGSFHFLGDLDRGGRTLVQCKKCRALFLRQYSHCYDYYGTGPMETILYFPVDSHEEALELNRKYNGFDFEYKYVEESKRLWTKRIDGRWKWNKEQVYETNPRENSIE